MKIFQEKLAISMVLRMSIKKRPQTYQKFS